MQKRYSIQEAVQWIIKQYHELQQEAQQNNHYRIIDQEQKNGEIKLCIQLVGKSIIFKATPREIINDDQLLEGFSKKEIKHITYLACQDIKQPKYKIVLQEFCSKLNRLVFRLKQKGSNQTVKATAAEISQDKTILNGLSQAEAHKVGYATAMEQQQAVDQQLQMAKEKETL